MVKSCFGVRCLENMDVVDFEYRDGLRVSAGKMKWLKEAPRWSAADNAKEEMDGRDEDLVEVLLRGRAPWGFTLRGGLEHREPLVITKVEEGSAAASVCLQAGDELAGVNGVPLSGYRQEAIGLVKGSQDTVALVVRRKVKMVDVPSEYEVHVARNFLTKILRSSMRKSRFKGKDDPASRPHSWHISKLTEEDLEPRGRETTPAHIRQPKYRPGSKESSNQDQSQSTHSADDMERFERPSHHYNPGRLSPASKYTSSPEPHCGGVNIRELSCLSGGSSPPHADRRPLASTCRSTATENIFFKGLQSQVSRPGERLRYLQPPPGSRGWERARAEEQVAPRVSSTSTSSSRPNFGPVWQVPERKLTQSPPPLRGDSFAISKVFPCSKGSVGQTGRGGDKLNHEMKTVKSHLSTTRHEKGPESRHGVNPTKDFLHPDMAADYNHNQLHPAKLFSLSSTDVRQSQAQPACPPNHQRQYSDESPFYAQTRLAPAQSHQTMGSYYRSLQDIPTNASSRKQAGSANQGSAAGPAADQNPENGSHDKYCGTAARLSGQIAEPQVRPGKTEGLRGDTDLSHWADGNGRSSLSSFKSGNKKYSLPQSKAPFIDSRDSNGHSQQGKDLGYEHPATELSSENQNRGEGHWNDNKAKTHPSQSHNDHKLKPPSSHVPWVPQEDNRISPFKTPLLHSLTQESWRKVAGSHGNNNSNSSSSCQAQDGGGDATPMAGGKAGRRGDRYATALRNEIQEKRAQLQKSRSAATLSHWEGEGEAGDGAFSNTYKDHLKEAQARVLQATSFQRRDLEPPAGEVPAGKAGAANVNNNHQLSRIGARKRFPLAKRVRSFSEPDKMDKVGAEGEAKAGSLSERRRLFESKPAASRDPRSKAGPPSWGADLDKAGRVKGGPTCGEPRGVRPSPGSRSPSPGRTQALLEQQQRLGTFAEYQATWSMQRKVSDAKAGGRYRSVENILDTDDRDKAVIHERSRSSPSADFYAGNIPVPLRGPVNNPSMGPRYEQQSREQLESRLSYQPGQPHQAAQPQPGSDHTVPSDRRTKSAVASHATLPAGPPGHSPSPGSQHPAQAAQTEGLLPPPWSHLGHQTTSCTQEFDPSAQAGPASLQAPSGSSPSPRTGPRNDTASQRCGASPGGTDPGAELLAAEASRQAMATEPPQPSSSKTLTLSRTSADGVRSPSPQFAPQRLTDKPPVVSHLPARPETGPREATCVHSQARRVPVRIVHAESSTERESRAYLAHHPKEAPECPEPPKPLSQLLVPGGAGLPSPPSPFSAYDTQRKAQAPTRSSGEDAEREELARDIMGRDKSLADILGQTGMKTTMDLMEGLFPQGEQVLEGAQQRRRAPAGPRQPSVSPRTAEERSEDEGVSASASLVPSSSYYSTSAPKAELLIKMKDMQEQLEEQDSEDELDIDLAGKKHQLISSLARKLEVLREARQSLQEDVEANEALGHQVEATVQSLCRPNQLDKFRMFVGDLDKVVSLLLSLSGRLARVENALNSLEDEAPPEEKRTLTEKRKLLMRQHEDAKELKENLDRRERLVSAIMETHLDAESLDDYRHFVKMKSALIIEQRKLEDKVKLGEEQLKCLVDSLPAEQRALL